MYRLLLTLGWVFVLAPALFAQGSTAQGEFLYGATVYPEFQTREERNKMLDDFQRAHFKVLRVGESSWGSLETAPGQYNFGWLREFLDELAPRTTPVDLPSRLATICLQKQGSDVSVSPRAG